MRKGFTLLELLTVVIIVAILASVAVPQFFKVAERARASEGVGILGAVRNAQLRYYSENGVLTAVWGDLDIDVPAQQFFAAPVPIAPVYVGAGEVIATIDRLAGASNPGFGAYTLSMQGNGTVTCAGGIRCPSGF